MSERSGLGMRMLRAAAPDSAKRSYWLAYPAGSDPLTVAAELHHHPLVRWADPDRLTERRWSDHVPSDYQYGNQYYLNNTVTSNGIPVDINVETAWLATTGSDIVVAVIGSGIDGSHPELSGRKQSGDCGDGWDEWNAESEYGGGPWEPWGEECEECLPWDDPHDTAVAGIIAADHDEGNIAGVAPNVKLFSARIGIPILQVAATPAQVEA